MLKEFLKKFRTSYYSSEQADLIADFLIDLINNPIKSAFAINDRYTSLGKMDTVEFSNLVLGRFAQLHGDPENDLIQPSKKEEVKVSMINYLNRHNAPIEISTDYNTPEVIHDMLEGTNTITGLGTTPIKSLIKISNEGIRFRSTSFDRYYSMDDLRQKFYDRNAKPKTQNDRVKGQHSYTPSRGRSR